ncbi:MAG: hypothetical protein M1445_14600 [Bacteroidetes bacterium]|nr:hypothetical protein [Bacteroidota bacterium]MCL6102532.1 hypothetical protein [Bacteroidota bacterium]
MTTVTGTYFNGHLKLERPIKTEKPVKVTVTFEEEVKSNLQVSDFSFLEVQEILKDYKGSFSDEVLKERRKAL